MPYPQRLESTTGERLRRYRHLASLALRYRKLGKESAPGDDHPAGRAENVAAERFVRELESLGPTFVKLGQVLSSRADLLPEPHRRALSRLQDNVEPVPFPEIKRIVEQELNAPLNGVFKVFWPRPVAAASMAQVHRAVLFNGREVAVKVQRPRLPERVAADFRMLTPLAELLERHSRIGGRYEVARILGEAEMMIRQELDYREELHHLRRLAEISKPFDRIHVPVPIPELCTSRVLTMEFVRGEKITALDPARRAEIDGHGLLSQLFSCYLQNIIADGFFHADPHPGNILLTDDDRLAFLDLGMVCKVGPATREQILLLLLAVAEGDAEEAAEHAISIGEQREGFDRAEFTRRVRDLVLAHHDASLERLRFGELILCIGEIAGSTHLRLPRELTMIGKVCANVEEVANVLDPQFDPSSAIRSEAPALLLRRFSASLLPTQLMSRSLEAKRCIERFPRAMNRLLDQLGSDRLRIDVDAIDEEFLMSGFQKVANRITVGLIVAAMVVCAGLMMDLPSGPRLFGHSAIAVILLLFAAGVGAGLVVTILWNDVTARRPKVKTKFP